MVNKLKSVKYAKKGNCKGKHVYVCYQACQEFLDALGKSTTFVSRASQKISFCTLLLFCDKMFT